MREPGPAECRGLLSTELVTIPSREKGGQHSWCCQKQQILHKTMHPPPAFVLRWEPPRLP